MQIIFWYTALSENKENEGYAFYFISVRNQESMFSFVLLSWGYIVCQVFAHVLQICMLVTSFYLAQD